MEPLTLKNILKYFRTKADHRLKLKEKMTIISIFTAVDTQNEIGEEVVNKKGRKGDGKLNAMEWDMFQNIVFTISDLYTKMEKFIDETNSKLIDDMFAEQTEEESADVDKTKVETDEYNILECNKKFDKTKFTPENIAKVFPNFDIEINEQGIYVKEKGNEDPYDYVFMLNYYEDKTITVSFNDGENNIKLAYNASGQLSKMEDNNILVSYNEAGQRTEETDKKTGITSSFNNNGELYARRGKLFGDKGDNNFYLAIYNNGKIENLTNIYTGLKTIYDENGDEKEIMYDGQVIADLFCSLGNNDVDEEFIKNLSLKERIDFCNMITGKVNVFAYNIEKLEFVLNTQMDIIKELGGYTADLEEFAQMYLDEVKTSDVFNDERLQGKLSNFMKHVNQRIAVLKDNKHQKIKHPNGKIDGNFKQGELGDCWLLSSIKAIASSENGRKRLNDMISIQKEHGKLISVTVKIQGKNYVIPKEELYSAVEFSTGDLDVRAIEIAVNKYCMENGYSSVTSGNTTKCGFSILLDDASELEVCDNITYSDSPDASGALYNLNNSINNNFISKLQSEKFVGVLGAAQPNRFAIDTKTGIAVPIIMKHAYTILKMDEKYVYLINPHDSSRTLRLDLKELPNTFAQGALFEL